MPAPTVTPSQIEDLIAGGDLQIETRFDKVTVAHLRLASGFVLTATSGAVCKENYSEAEGTKNCMARIRDQLWMLEGYALAKQLAESAD